MSVDARGALVLGASGFIGGWVARELQRRGVPVTAVVRDLARATTTLATWPQGPACVRADLEVPGEGAEVIRRHRPSMVFNLAGYGVDRTETDPARARRLNHELVRELAEACAEPGVDATLVHVGSAAEYGDVVGVLREDGPTRPQGTYGVTKHDGTEALVAVARRTGARAICARLFTVFGEGEHDGRLLPVLRAAARGEGLIPLSAGLQERDFAWVGDVAPALVDLAGARWAPGTVVNLATGRSHTVRAFVLAAARALGIAEERLGFGAVASQAGDIAGFTVSVERLHAILGRVLPGDLDAMLAAAVRPGH
ncbi:MAG: NAD-dependent epimerase/dehydratase family protein [Gemmatimonadetes bacterium]|nr:NAD-dependent epimerase/dehydratase family protein [Gemmatimonadota bacterium]